MNRAHNQRGVVSIFLVVFTALLITVVTASFIQIMVNNQQQATNNDLSQRAYDSALAGVEDAKRVLLRLKECELNDESAGCANIRKALDSKSCTSLNDTGTGVGEFTGDGEVVIGDESLNQAYTCVKVQLNTDTVKGALPGNGTSDVRQLRSTGDGFTTLRVSWYQQSDLPTNPFTGQHEEPSLDFTNFDRGDLPAYDEWPRSQPPILRLQLIQFKKGTIDLEAFNEPGTPNARTLFLYPSDIAAGSEVSFDDDARRDAATERNSLKQVQCKANFEGGDAYLCSVEISLPLPKGGTKTDREAYLQLASYYNDTAYSIELFDGNTPEKFNTVQPIVDSTGRASDLFRRVEARVSLGGSSLPYPDAALHVRNNLCKDFFITDDAGDFYDTNDSVDCSEAGPN